MSQANRPGSPRQKMINLMYIVLTAMLALYISHDVLDGFSQVDAGLTRTGAEIERRNAATYAAIENAALTNPVKAQAWADRGADVRRRSASLYAMIDSLKYAIARQADGPGGNPSALDNLEDKDASADVMLSGPEPNARALRDSVDAFSAYARTFVSDPAIQSGIARALSTDSVSRKPGADPQPWEQAWFDKQPAIAAITLLTKLQNDVRYAEGEALSSIHTMIDAGDVRVNELNAFVIPRSQYVMRGSRYSADIVLAAVDTTSRPAIYIGGTRLPATDGHYEQTAAGSGTHKVEGYLEVTHGDGSSSRHPFASSYTVIEPSATVSATMMNVLYAGIANPVSISVPGVPASAVSATMTNGTLTRSGDHWTARPGAPGTPATITVTADMDGSRRTVATHTFRVRRLPDPTAYIIIGADNRYKGGRPLPKASLLASPGLGAAIDDDMLDIDFTVLSFETIVFDSMGNAMAEVSDGNRFSRRQLDSFRRLSRGKRFFITRIKVKGPDGAERTLSPLEVTIG